MRDADALLRDGERQDSDRAAEHVSPAKVADRISAESQDLRFEQLARLWGTETGALNLIDYGCGHGAFADWLRARGTSIKYQGFDVSGEIEGKPVVRARADCTFTSRPESLTTADWVVANGIFNVKLSHDATAWTAHVRRTVAAMAALARRGFAFNALTSHADPEKQRPDLYYADPGYWFDFCKRAHSPRVTLVHDYPLHEFTLLVRV